MPLHQSATFTCQLLPLLALGLDWLIGDPEWSWHPARLAGRLCQRLEPTARSLFLNPRNAGCAAAAAIVFLLAVPAGLAVWVLQHFSHLLGYLLALFLVYTAVALRDLYEHARAVLQALEAGDLPEARIRVARIVGRDTAHLDEPQIVRATLESIGESTCDGVTAPLFYAALGAVLGGAPLAAAFAIAYRTANTLDSTFGYKDERYLHFGWASARLDDLLNFLPARLSAYTVVAAALAGGYDWSRALSVLRRDGRKHESPNSGLGEAVLAGALGVQLGGENLYHGEAKMTPLIGEPIAQLERNQIRLANRLLTLTALLFAAFLFVLASLLRAG